MTDHAQTKTKILKFVKLLDGGDSEESVMARAQSRNWLDNYGIPTLAGIELIKNSERMNRFAGREL